LKKLFLLVNIKKLNPLAESKGVFMILFYCFSQKALEQCVVINKGDFTRKHCHTKQVFGAKDN